MIPGRRAGKRILFVYNSNEHIGLTYLSAVLKAQGHEVRLAWDPQVFRGEPLVRIPPLLRALDKTKKIVDLALAWRPDLIGLGCYTDNFAWMIGVASAMKAAGVPAPLVFGGVHVTSVPAAVASYPCVDALVLGEAEGAITELVDGLDGSTLPTGIRNTWIRRADGWERNPLRPYIDDLDSIPIRDFELFYRKVPVMEENYLCMGSRGCPFACSYCAVEMYHRNYMEIGDKRRVRRRSPAATLEELRVLKGRGRVRSVSFMDDVFTIDRKWLDDFLEGYQRDIGLPFWCYTYPTALDPGLLRTLRRAGCWMMTMGVQSGSGTVRKELFNRKETDERVVATARAIREAGILLSVDKIVGAPGESEQDRQRDVDLFRRVAPDRILVFPLTYFPGTDMIRKARERGELSVDDVEAIEHGRLEQNPVHGRMRAEPAAYRKLRLQMGLIPLLRERSPVLDPVATVLARLPGSDLLHPALLAANAARIGDRKFSYLMKILTGAVEVP